MNNVKNTQTKLFYKKYLKNINRNKSMLARIMQEINKNSSQMEYRKSYEGAKKFALLNSTNRRKSIAKREQNVQLQEQLEAEYLYTIGK